MTNLISQSSMADGVRSYTGSDDRLRCEVGMRHCDLIKATGESGYLIFGPHEHFEPGRYRVFIRGYAENWCQNEWIDVVCNKNMDVLLHIDLRGLQNGIWQEIFEFNLDVSCSDLAIRIWVGQHSWLTVEHIKIVPIKIRSIGIIIATYGMVPNLPVNSVGSTYDIKWYIYHHGSKKLIEGIEKLFDCSDVYFDFICENVGLSKSWNRGIFSSLMNGDDIAIIINDDVEFVKNGFDDWIKFITQDRSYGLYFLNGEEPQEEGEPIVRSQRFACFSIGLQALQLVGAFDEEIVPAYYEDADYTARYLIAGVSVANDDRILCVHKRSTTIKNNYEIAEQLPAFISRNGHYMISKWGDLIPENSKYKKPFNDKKRSIHIPFNMW